MLKKLPDHPLAQLFPMADKPDSDRIDKSLEEIGQLEEIITLDKMVLDGRNRQDLLIARGVQPRYMDWTELPEVLTKNGPLAYVKARNMDRRHLTKSQLGIIAAEYSKLLENEAAERKAAGLKQNAAPSAQKKANGDEFSQDDGTRPEDESQVSPKRGSGKKTTDAGKTAAIAGAAFGVSRSQVEKGRGLLKKDPKKAAEVKAGKGSLSKAVRDKNKEEAARKEFDTAVSRIAGVGGKPLAEEMKKRKRKDVIELAEMSDADIQKCRGLLIHGWQLARVRSAKMTALTRTSTIGELLTRAIAKGVLAGDGAFKHEITFEEIPFEITVSPKKK